MAVGVQSAAQQGGPLRTPDRGRARTTRRVSRKSHATRYCFVARAAVPN